MQENEQHQPTASPAAAETGPETNKKKSARSNFYAASVMASLAVLGVQYVERTASSFVVADTAPSLSDTHRKLFILSRNSRDYSEWIGRNLYFRHDVLVDTNARGRNFSAAIADEATAQAPLDELVIASNGDGSLLLPNGNDEHNNPEDKITVLTILGDLANAQQKSGHRITGRIVFLGSNVYANLSPDQVAAYREAAHRLGAEIVAPTNSVLNYFFSSGRFAKFMPDGHTVLRDSLDMPFDPLIRTLQFIDENGVSMSDNGQISDNSSDWFTTAQTENDRPVTNAPATARSALRPAP